jgi:Tfp pilus assembly PilM family ATPase
MFGAILLRRFWTSIWSDAVKIDEGKKYLAVEIARKTVSIMEFIPGTSPLKITNFARAKKPGGEPSDVARFLREMARDAGITGEKALVVIKEPVIEHRTYVIPKVPKQERDVLVMRKLEEDVSTPLSELSVANTVIGDTVDKGVEKDEVLVVSTPSFEVKRALYIVIEAGWEPVLMTTFPVACANLHPSTESDNFVSFVSLSEGKSFVTVSRNGKPKFSREFFLEFGHSAAPEQSMDYQNIGEVEEEQLQNVIDERIVTELSRSFLYFKQFSRGETIRKAYLMGEHCGEALAKTVEDRFVIDVEPPEKLLAGQFDLQGDALPKAGEFDISLFTHLIGMAMKTSRKEEINLLPQEYVERKKRFLKRSFFYGAAAMYVLANLVLILGIMSAKNHYKDVAKDIEQLAPVIYKNRDYANRVYDLKRRAEESEAILRELDHRKQFCGSWIIPSRGGSNVSDLYPRLHPGQLPMMS